MGKKIDEIFKIDIEAKLTLKNNCFLCDFGLPSYSFWELNIYFIQNSKKKKKPPLIKSSCTLLYSQK